MDGIRKYSKEWFTLNGTEEQHKAIVSLQNGVEHKSYKTSATLQKSIFIGSREEVEENFSKHSKSIHGAPSSTQLGVRDYGLGNIFNALDADGDGFVTENEINDVAALSTQEFADKDDTYFSTQDLDLLYQNAMDAVDSSFINMGNKSEFHYENGDVTKVYLGSDGKISSKYVEKMNEDGSKEGISYYYNDKSTTTTSFDSQGRVTQIERDTNNPKKDYTKAIAYNEDKSRIVTTVEYVTTTETKYDSLGKFVSKDVNYNYEIDGKIGDTEQESIGDCWVLAGVNSLRDSDVGRAYLKNAIKQNDDGSVTVYLKGVNKEYTYSAEEIIDNEYNTPSLQYSTGDTDMNLFEMAIGDYRKELIASGDYDKNGRDLSRTAGKEATVDDPLKGGQLDEAIYYITGLKSDYICNDKESAMNMVEQYQTGVNKYIMNVSFNNKDESIKEGTITTAHAYSITKVDDDYVYVVNPWNSSVEIPYPKEDFYNNAKQVTITDLMPGKYEQFISAMPENADFQPIKQDDFSIQNKLKDIFDKIFS